MMDFLAQCPCSGGGGSGGGVNRLALLALLALAFGLWQAVKWTTATWNTEGTSTMRRFSKIGVIVALVGAFAAIAGMQFMGQSATAEPAAPAPGPGGEKTVSSAYPTLASGGLVHARLAELPEGVLLQAGEVTVTQKDLDAEIAKAPKTVREQLRKYAFFQLEQTATKALLLKEAGAQAGKDAAGTDERALIQGYLGKLGEKLKVSDEEIADFHKNNMDVMGGAALEKVKPQIAEYLRQQKQQELVAQHIKTLGQRTSIEVSAAWAKAQAVLAKDNPVDKARASGKPSLVDFGAKGCIPCEKLAPILETLKTKYEGKANVLFVMVLEQQILAARYSVESIPVQVFFDKDGKEVFRHTGFWPQEQLEKKLAEMGVK